MPRHSGLLCRKGTYYLNVRVPKDLRAAFGRKEIIRKSLGTSDYREAVSRVRFEAFRLEGEFAEKRREMKIAKRASTPPPVLSELSDREACDIVIRFFVGLEKISEEWSEKDVSEFGEEDREQSLDALRADEVVFSGGSRHYQADDGSEDLMNFLKQEGIEIPSGSPAFRKLCPLFRKARLESTRRTMDRVENKTVRPREPLFQEVFAHSDAPPARQIVTLGAMLKKYAQWLTDAGRSQGTHRTYEIPARILREVIGEHTALEAITKERIEQLFDLLRRAPTNAAQRYRGMTIAQSITAADKAGDDLRLGRKTLANYFNNIVAILNFAVGKGFLAENPAKDRYLRATFERDGEAKPKVLFSTDELTRLFRAPLFTGCEDDENGYAKPGTNKPRRGRFWLPLLALFHGFRCNEAGQLYTEDVCEVEGVPYFEIREERADGSKCDKCLKTKQSKRRVPIHPKILRIGFLDYVVERRRDALQPRLFPDLEIGANGYFSDPFSKWFGRFRKAALGKECKATFHSFRHHFRDAMRDAEISIEYVEAVCGWGNGRRSEEKRYGTGPSLQRLREQMEKVKYPSLDLSHLYPAKAVCRVRRKRKSES